jgi:hypothetical protein
MMSLFNSLIQSGGLGDPSACTPQGYYEQAKSMSQYKQRTFKETVADQIASHQRKIDDLQAVLDSLSPEVEKFVEALQRVG